LPECLACKVRTAATRDDRTYSRAKLRRRDERSRAPGARPKVADSQMPDVRFVRDPIGPLI